MTCQIIFASMKQTMAISTVRRCNPYANQGLGLPRRTLRQHLSTVGKNLLDSMDSGA